MNINDLTLGEIKEVAALVGCAQPTENLGVATRYVGKYVIVRSRNEGVNAGKVIEADSTGVLLEDARRLWWHRPKSKEDSWYEGVAKHGISNDTKCSCPRDKAIIEDYSMTVCSSESEESIRSAVSHAQS
jgi:hypothetical protein